VAVERGAAEIELTPRQIARYLAGVARPPRKGAA